jgi:hypothetical protein
VLRYCYNSVTYEKQENIELKVYYNNKELRNKIVGSYVFGNICISDSIIYLCSRLSDGRQRITAINSYDLDSLNKNNSIQLLFASSKIFCQENKLFVISNEEPCINIFNGDLEHIESIALSYDPYYKMTNQIFIKNVFFFTQNVNNIRGV